MSYPYANYEVVGLSGTKNLYPFDSTNYRTATTVHQIYCLQTGSITIYPMLGPSFTWTPASGLTMDVLVSAVTVNSGTFIGFRARNDVNPFYSRGANQ